VLSSICTKHLGGVTLKIIILAGGSGERFWPVSTAETPKQFLKLFGEKTLLRQTFERLSFKASPKDIYIVTHRNYKEKTLAEVPEIPKENILLEPSKKNTAPACTYACLQLDKDEIIFIVPADHFIPQIEEFWSDVEVAEKFLQTHQGILTFGIVPTRPETNYGYIEVSQQIEGEIFKVQRFHEKPDYKTALNYIEKGSYLWNSGMFMYKNNYFIEQMKRHAPQVIQPFFMHSDIEKTYDLVPSISIDYALMEKAEQMYTVKARFIWSDVGNFLSLKELGMKNSKDAVTIDSENVFINTTKPTIVIGMSDVVIVETQNGILVSKMQGLEKIRDALRKIT